jgi:hypothetical protein
MSFDRSGRGFSFEKHRELEYELRHEDEQADFEFGHRASAKSIAYAKSLIERAKKFPQLKEKAERHEASLAKDGGRSRHSVPYNIATVSYAIADLKESLDALFKSFAEAKASREVEPKVTVSVANVEPASAKQIGFMSSLLKRKDVPADLLAQVDGAKADKRKASKVIDALTKCADKSPVSA